jgi:hypothetical protein
MLKQIKNPFSASTPAKFFGRKKHLVFANEDHEALFCQYQPAKWHTHASFISEQP